MVHEAPTEPPDTVEEFVRSYLKASPGDEIAVEAEDGTKFKIRASSEQLDTLTGDLETILDGDDASDA